MKAALRVIYPPQCLACAAPVEQDGALCPVCWRDCEFVTGCACCRCGVPLPGTDRNPDDNMASLICDGCLATERPWRRGCAALTYRDVGRQLVLSLKHGDRPDLAGPLGGWLAQAVMPLIRPGMIVIPVPIHPRRLISRKFNQAMLLSAQVAHVHRLQYGPAILRRTRATPPQDHRSYAERHENLRNAIAVAPRQRDDIRGRTVLLVDDVMASGATMVAAADALREAGAGSVSIAVLARALNARDC